MAADDDYECDLCGTVRKQRDMTLVSPELFKDAVRAGLRPNQSVSAGISERDLLADGVAKALQADWVAKALTDDTGWGLCQSCTSRVQGYLRNDGTWSVRGAQSR
jgi:hypothetical protein